MLSRKIQPVQYYYSLCLVGLLLVVWIEQTASFVAPPCARHDGGQASAPALISRQRQGQTAASSRTSSCDDQKVVIALTREEGKNDKMKAALLDFKHDDDSNTEQTLQAVEVPCIAHADGPDFDRLAETLEQNKDEQTSKKWDYVAVTSPEAARVLISAWKDCSSFPSSSSSNQHITPAVAAVGKATQAVLEQAGITVSFCPSKATAATLVKELPFPKDQQDDESSSSSSSSSSSQPRVLYPASARAQTTLQDGLTARGFAVTRLDTYDTVTAVWSPQQQQSANEAQIACFASPSAVKGWLQNTKSNNNNSNSSSSEDDSSSSLSSPRVLAACIGETSARACRQHGWPEEAIFYPEKPGIPGWVQAVSDASAAIGIRKEAAATTTTTAA